MRGVSKDGRRRGCGHPSELARAGEHLRMTARCSVADVCIWSRLLLGGLMLLRILDRLEEILISTLMGTATVLVFISVLHRFGTGIPFLYPYLIQVHIAWTQELCIYMF